MFTRGVQLTLVGSAGSATASETITVPKGRLVAIAAAFDSQPATLDTTISDAELGGAIVTLTDSNTDFGWTAIRIDGIDQVGAAAADPGPAIVGSTSLTIAAAGGDAGTMTVYVAIEPSGTYN